MNESNPYSQPETQDAPKSARRNRGLPTAVGIFIAIVAAIFASVCTFFFTCFGIVIVSDNSNRLNVSLDSLVGLSGLAAIVVFIAVTMFLLRVLSPSRKTQPTRSTQPPLPTSKEATDRRP